MVNMKATIEVPDDLYRRVKAKSALQGLPVREVTIQLFRRWLDESDTPTPPKTSAGLEADRPAWAGSLRRYAKNAKGRHDMESIRNSVGRGRFRPRDDSR